MKAHLSMEVTMIVIHSQLVYGIQLTFIMGPLSLNINTIFVILLAFFLYQKRKIIWYFILLIIFCLHK